MIARNLSNSPKVPFNLEGYILQSNSKTEIVHLTLNPGEKIDPHSNPFDVIFYILSGIACTNKNHEEYNLVQGDCVEISANVSRSIQNNGTTPLQLLVFKIF